jgi:hypothetical protein
MKDLDRRQFLKGLLGTAAVAAIALPAIAEAKALASPPPLPKSVSISSRVEMSPGIIHIDGAGVVPGDTLMIQYSSNSGDNGIYEVKAVHHNGQEVSIARVFDGKTEHMRMPINKLEGYLNDEIANLSTQTHHLKLPAHNRKGRRQQRRGFRTLTEPSAPNRPLRTWPTPRRPHRR